MLNTPAGPGPASIVTGVRIGLLVPMLLLVACGRTPDRSELDMQVGAPVRAARVAGQDRLVYELHVSNPGGSPVEITSLKVVDGDDKAILVLEGERLRRSLGSEGGHMVLPAHASVVAYLDVSISDAVPRAIRHRATLRTGATVRVVEGSRVTVIADVGPTLAPPLGGGPWVAVYSSEWPRGHRRVLYDVGGQSRIPGRFAIDWLRVDADGRTSVDASGLTASSLSYGAPVLAVADSRVAAARDGVTEADRIVDNRSHPHPDAAGNFISLALGKGRFATYEHLRPGSLKVVVGQKVRAGEVIAEIGFSGDSTEPHLHFHVSDSPMPLAGEGIPYSLSRFHLLGRYADWKDLGRRRWQAGGQGSVVNELPSGGDVIEFDGAQAGNGAGAQE